MTGFIHKSNLFIFLQIALLLLIAFFIATTQLTNLDIWWHISVGRYILQEHSIPTRDAFSFAAPALPCSNGAWLFGIVFYPIAVALGIKGLVVAKAVLCLLTFAMFFNLVKSRCGNRYITLGIALWVIVITNGQWALKPGIFAYLFITVLLIWLHQYISGRSRYIYIAPILMILWVSFYQFTLAGMIVIAVYILGEIIKRICRRFSNRTTWPLLNIRGIIVLIVIFILCYLVQIGMGYIGLSAQITSPVDAKPLSPLEFPAYGLMLLAAATALFININVMDPTDSLMLLVFGILSFKSAGSACLFAFCAAPVLSRQAADLAHQIPATTTILLEKARRWFDLAICIALVVVLLWSVGRPDFGFSTSPMLLPQWAADYISKNKPEKEIFNPSNWSSYIIWRLYPSYRVLIDDRGASAYSTNTWQDYQNIESGAKNWEELCDRYGVNLFLIPARQEMYKLIERLWGTPNWRLVYWDLGSLIYVRDIPANRSMISSFEYKNFDPKKEELDYWMESFRFQSVSEIKRFLKDFPNRLKPRSFLAMQYMNAGRPREAAAEYETILTINPKAPTVHHNLGLIASFLGDKKKAEEEYRKEIELNPSFPPALNNLGRIYFQRKELEKAEEFFRKALKIDPNYTHALNNLALIYLDQGQYDKAVAELETVLKINPRDRTAFNNLRYAQKLVIQQAAESRAKGREEGSSN